MTEAARLADLITQLLPDTKSGSLRLFGEWFGGRKDNWHVITDAAASGNELIVGFNEGETLVVSEPLGARIDPQTFEIPGAARVRWEWFYYGRPKVAANRYVLEYEKTTGGVSVRDTTDWYVPDHQPDASAAAVLID